jgi:predicted porin
VSAFPIDVRLTGIAMTDLLRRSVSGVAILAAVGLMLAAPQPARAGDLGGDCCADLEERVAVLESTTVRKGNKKVSLTISGRVHAGVMWWQDNSGLTDPAEPFDHLSDVYFGNTAGSGNRIVFDGDAKISPDLTAGFQMTVKNDFGGVHSQIEHQSGPSLAGEVTYVYLSSKRLGELRLGNLYSASDDAYYNDFGSPGVVGGLSGTRFVGDFILRNTGGALTDVTYGHVLYELADDVENRLMYISPEFGGLTVKADIGGDDTASVGVNWSVTRGKWNLAAGVGYQVSHRGDAISPDGDQNPQLDAASLEPLTDTAHDTLRALAVSASIYESGTGLFATGQYSASYAAIPGRQDATNWYARAGWTKDITGLGATTLDVQYERTDNLHANNTSAHLWGAGIDQSLDSVASTIYLHYQHDSLDTAFDTPCGIESTCTVAPQSIDSVTGGMIVRF